MIDISHVSKAYKSDIYVVNDVSLQVKKGEIFGLLGPNGAGKTTLMQMVATLLKPSSGQIQICGMTTVDNEIEIRKKMGFLTSDVKLEPESTPDKLFNYFGTLYGLSKKAIEKRKEESFERFGIAPFAYKKINQLSTGMNQKISISISLIHNPDVIIFDEPTNGLDILTSYQVCSYLRELKDNGRVILLSTHIFSVAESLCDRIAVLIDGKNVAEGSVSELLNYTQKTNFEEAFLKLYTQHHKE